MSGTPGSATVRKSYRTLARWLETAPPDLLQARSRQAELFFRRMGVTFAVYGDVESNERLIPFDVVPRIIGASEWDQLEKGLKQRVSALNAFLKDIYGPAGMHQGGHRPGRPYPDQSALSPRRCRGAGRRATSGPTSAGSTWSAPARTAFLVLEDNCRTPSGVSYMLENREMMMRLFPDLFAELCASDRSRPTPTCCWRRSGRRRRSTPGKDPTIVVLTPGPV
jgi:uncharacterized circularly permuted ATP-grasp superfamily protein